MKSNLTKYIEKKLNLSNSIFDLAVEYEYSCVPLSVIDAIYSIRLNYSTTKKIVKNYCEYYHIAIYKNDDNHKIHSVTDLINNINEKGFESFATDVLESKNKTAGANPILKSEAVYYFAEILRNNGIECFNDFKKADKEKLKRELLNVHGQGMAVVNYFFMLCGDEDICKPDTHLLEFLTCAEERNVKPDEALVLIKSAVSELKKDYPNMTVRRLDYIIWLHRKLNL